MEIKHKSIRREPWASLLKRTQVFFSAEDGSAVSLLRFDRLSSPIIRDYGDGLSGTVADDGGYWLQLARDGDNYWYTAYFDQSGEFRQVYIDITGGNDCRSAETACFDDLFSDIVYTAEGRIYIFDEDELFSALSEGVINKTVFEKVKRLMTEKVAFLETDGEKLKAQLISLFDKAVNML